MTAEEEALARLRAVAGADLRAWLEVTERLCAAGLTIWQLDLIVRLWPAGQMNTHG